MTTQPAGGQGPDHEAISAWLVTEIADQAGFAPDQVDVDEPLTSYGLGSREAVMLTGALEDWLGRSLSPTLAFEYPTVDALARHLAGTPDRAVGATETGTAGTAPAVATPVAVPVAVVGIGCRFPGARDADEFWQLLRDGVDAIREVPADRWDADRLYDGEPDTPGRMTTRWGGFVDDVGLFDAGFFGISQREAAGLDPQQRMLLEVTWDALESAGQATDRLARTQTGVFVGISTMDYSHLRVQRPDHTTRTDAYASTGNAHSIAANRLSYTLDLRGPSVAVDTACSSSLVALHLAAQSLGNGESDLALAGGVNVVLEPSVTMSFSRARMMAADGRCKAFDASADGYVRGEGCGVLVLRRLDDAVRDGDRIYGVVRGTAVNQDGRTAGLTAPSGAAQQTVVRTALARAGVEPDEIGLVEAHGTGTALGDPIEVNSLAAVLGRPSSVAPTCWISSVKTNIGHLEAAAGIAGVIKVLLSLDNDTIPRHLHLRTVNPLIELAGTRLAIPVEPQPWQRSSGPRLAGVSSFGFGGTNAHVVLAEAPALPPTAGTGEGAGSRPVSPQVLALSAHTRGALEQQVRDYLAVLEPAAADPAFADSAFWDLDVDEPAPLDPAGFADLCYTSGLLRAHHDHRLAVVAGRAEEAAAKLRAFLRGVTLPGLLAGRRIVSRSTGSAATAPADGPRPAPSPATGNTGDTGDTGDTGNTGNTGDTGDGSTTTSAKPSVASDRAAALDRLAARYVTGDRVDWAAVAGEGRRLVRLPRYPWQRQHHWFASGAGGPADARQPSDAPPPGDAPQPGNAGPQSARDPAPAGSRSRDPEVHPLLGREAALAPAAGVRIWEARLDLAGGRLAYLGEHRLHGTAVLPAAAYVEMALAAARTVLGAGPRRSEDHSEDRSEDKVPELEDVVLELEDMVLERPLELSPEDPRTVQTILTRASASEFGFQICSNALADDLGWLLHARGRVRRG
jgi:acyl transferase domain-containing protein/acyl carrier protein